MERFWNDDVTYDFRMVFHGQEQTKSNKALEYLIHGINNNSIKALIATDIASGIDRLDNPVTTRVC